MELVPKYSYEYNCILNPEENEMQKLQGFASLLSDKERFLPLVKSIYHNKELMENVLGNHLPERLEFYVVRAEKFLSFSEPITIEYSLFPEKMLLSLLKEITKVSVGVRFPDEETRETYVNSFVEYLIENGEWPNMNFTEYFESLHQDSEKNYSSYKREKIDFSEKSLRNMVEDMYQE